MPRRIHRMIEDAVRARARALSPRKIHQAAVYACELLEERRFLSVTAVGALHGRAYFANQSINSVNDDNRYTLTLPTAATLQIQLSRLPTIPAFGGEDFHLVLLHG